MTRLRRIAAILAVVGILGTIAGQAGAVDGFSQPTYTPNSNPQIDQSEPCSGNSTVCWRWMRSNGDEYQGPGSQRSHEMPLIAVVCAYGHRFNANHTWTWVWQGQTAAAQPGGVVTQAYQFCLYNSWWNRT